MESNGKDKKNFDLSKIVINDDIDESSKEKEATLEEKEAKISSSTEGKKKETKTPAHKELSVEECLFDMWVLARELEKKRRIGK